VGFSLIQSSFTTAGLGSDEGADHLIKGDVADLTARIAEFDMCKLYDVRGGDSLVLYI
jgi:hypothetical protein